MGLFIFLTNGSSTVIQISNIHDIQNWSTPHIKLLIMAIKTYSAHPGWCANSLSPWLLTQLAHPFWSSYLGSQAPHLRLASIASHTVPSSGLSQHNQSPSGLLPLPIPGLNLRWSSTPVSSISLMPSVKFPLECPDSGDPKLQLSPIYNLRLFQYSVLLLLCLAPFILSFHKDLQVSIILMS